MNMEYRNLFYIIDRRFKALYNNEHKVKLICPRCNRPTKVMVIAEMTVLERFPLWCEKCRIESVINYGVSQNPSRSEPTA